ncbi:MAG: hypothetical protein GF411_11965 [Candidatus Lokiarchaeota archaeon]|nr:hypothetical protein [Candidatus Lokiarchaeota archaeon]
MFRARPARIDLNSFLKQTPSKVRDKQYFLFSEESVISIGHRYKGRFDQAVLHFEEAPILDLMIERKFPIKYLPREARKEDMFQAALYAQAIQESGASCSKTKLVIIYCLQQHAARCENNRNTTDCISCDFGEAFTQKYDQKWILRELKRLDEIWFGSRKPIAEPGEKCRPCPYSKNGICQYSIY